LKRLNLNLLTGEAGFFNVNLNCPSTSITCHLAAVTSRREKQKGLRGIKRLEAWD